MVILVLHKPMRLLLPFMLRMAMVAIDCPGNMNRHHHFFVNMY